VRYRELTIASILLLIIAANAGAVDKTTLLGKIVDLQSGKLLSARLYITSANGQWLTALSADKQGSAVHYHKQRGKKSVEIHTTLSAHPFVVDLLPGRYTLTAERGKEYFPVTQTIEIGSKPAEITLKLKRWIDMVAEGWYSGETHVHRSLEDLPTAMLADDLNVALPLTYWVTQGGLLPSQGDKTSAVVKGELIRVDATHVIYPMNTEYEIFTVDGKRHALGAVFGLNHKNVLKVGAPPVGPIA